MSTTIDQKVVEMRFDNKHFETHTKQSMSTLDKLKEKLNLTGASKGLENITASANKVNMSGMANAIDSVHSRFSALEVMGVTALVNITNSAVNAGKRMIHALTIAPVSDGFSEYEMTLNAIQTTMAATNKSAKEVQEELKKLDEYADKTVYSTADMLNNLPKFTNAGVELEQATKAMIGIANATALAGGDASKASIAFYNLGQAIGTGYLTRMDYNSINNAGIATMKWKEQMVEAAIAAGTLTKVGEDQYQAGKKTLTLQQLFIDGLQEQWATTDVMMKVFGDYGDETTEIGKKSYAAAQDIKTFSMMMDSLKATAGTGWKDTWQIIFGDLDEAKKFWTGLNNFISSIITKVADFRNNLLKGVLTFNPFTTLMEKLKSSSFGKAVKNINNITKSLEYYQDMVTKVWRGDYKNQPFRKGLLEDEGHNFSVIQTLVNKGYQYQLTLEDVAEAEKKFGISVSESAEALDTLTDEKLKDLGLTEEEIKLYRELEKQSKTTGKSISEIIESMEKKDTRTLLIEGLANSGRSLVGVFEAMGHAWKNIFMPDEVSVLALRIYNVVDAFAKFSENLLLTDKETGKLNENGEKLRRTFEGIFAIFDIILTVVAGPLGIALKILWQFLKALNPDILSLTAAMSDVIVAFRDWLDSVLDFTGFFEKLVPHIKEAAKAFREWLQSLTKTDKFKQFNAYMLEARDAIVEWFKSLKQINANDIISFFKRLGDAIKNLCASIDKHFDGIPGDILAGLINGLKNGASKVIDTLVEIGRNLITYFKDVFEIKSPSRVFMAIGGFIIAGLIAGLVGGKGELGNTMRSVVDNITTFFGNIDWSKVFSAGMSAGLLYMSKKVIDILGALSSPFLGVGSVLSSVSDVIDKSSRGIKKILNNTAKVVKSFSKVLNSIAFEHNAEGVKKLSISLLILVASIAILTKLDITAMWNAVAIIGVLAAILAALAFVLNKISETSLEINKTGLKKTGVKSTILTIGLALLAMASVVKTLGKMDEDEIKQGFLGLIGAVAALSAFIAAYGLLVKGKAAQHMKDAGKMMRKMATTMLLMVAVIKLVSFLKWTELGKGAAFLAGFLAFTAALFAISLIPSKNINKLGWTMIGISTALLLMIGVVKLASTLKTGELIKGAAFAAAFLIFIGTLVKITKIGKDDKIAKVGTIMLGISFAMLIMVGVIKLISLMSGEELAKGLIVIALFGLIIKLLISCVAKNGIQTVKIAGTLLAFAVAIGILVGIAHLINLMDVGALAKGLIAIGLFSLFITMMMKSTKGVNDVKGNFIGMSIAIGIMAASIALLSFIDWKKLLPAAVAMSALMGMFALIANQSKHVTGSMGCLITMTAAILVMAIALVLIAKLPAEQALAAAGSLSMVMLAMAGVMFIIGSSAPITKEALLGLVGILGIIASLYLVVDILKRMQNIQNAAENLNALTVFIGVLSIVQVLCAAVGASYAATGGMSALGLAGMAALILELYLVMGVLAIMASVPDAISNLKALEIFLITMTAVLVVLALVGPAAMIGVGAMWSLIGLMGVIGVLAVAIGALMKEFPTIQEFLDTGLDVLIQLAGGIGEMIGAFIGGALEQISNSLPAIGSNLSGFMKNASGFIEGARAVDSDVLAGVGILAAAIIALTAAELIAGIGWLLTGGTSLSEFGTEISAFMNNAKDFIENAKLVDPAIMTGVKTLADAILVLTGANVIQGIASWINGGTSLADFGAELGSLGFNLKSFATNLGTFSDSQLLAIDCASKAIKALAETAKELPGDGGLWAALFGEKSLATFGAQLPTLGRNLSGFISNLGTFSDSQLEAVKCAGKAIVSLAEAANEIPAEDGLWQGIVGEKSLATFGDRLPALGRNLSSFITNLGTFTDSQVATIDCAGRAIKALASAANEIPSEDGLWQKIVGEKSLATFGGHLPGLATNLKNFVANLGTFNDAQVSTVSSACQAISTIALLGTIDIDDTGDELNSFGKKMVNFAEKVKDFVSTLNGVSSDGVNVSIGKVQGLIAMAQSVASVNVESLKTFGESLKTFAKDGVDKFVNEFSGMDPKARAKTAVKEMIQAGIDGADAKKDEVVDKFEEIAEDAAESLTSKSVLDDVEQAGKDFVQGFANGIKNNKYLATDAGSSIGKAALAAAKEAIDSNSPSKEAMKLGNFFGEGFVIGIRDYGARVYDTSYAIADGAKNGLSKAISRVSDLIGNGIDTQPTIRPVLDLSDVESGAGYLNSMFNNGPSVGVMANLGSISAGMNARIQNGTNNDVISAIDKLSKNLGNVSGNTYNINGITYDDGSNITDAVKTLIRAAKVERRV